MFGEHSRQYLRLPGSYTTTPQGIREYLNSMVSCVASNLDDVKYYWEDDETSPAHPIDQSDISALDSDRIDKRSGSERVFVIHGHDEAARQAVARFLKNLELEPIILHEQSSRGRTIIEKFEQHAEVGFVVALLTPDDVGARKGEENNLNPRARQNVIFEFGYLIGKLSRKRVCALVKGNVEKPSDYDGVLYIVHRQNCSAHEIKALTTHERYAPLEFRAEDGETPPLCSTLLSSSSHLASVSFGRCVGAAPT